MKKGSTSERIGLNMAALFVSRVVGMALTLAQSAIVFRALDVEGTGQFGHALAYTGVFNVFATFGVQRLLVRDIARDPSTAWTQVWTAAALVAGLSLATLGIAMAGTALAGEDAASRSAVFYAALSTIVLWALQRPFEAMLTAREEMSGVAVVNVAAAVLKLAAVAIAMRYSPTSAMAHGAIAAANLAAFLLCVGWVVRVAGWERPRVRIGLAIAQLRECMPLLLSMIFSALYFRADMVVLNAVAGPGEAAMYTPVQRIMEPLMMLSSLWGTAIFPAMSRLSAQPGAHFAMLKRSSARLALIGAFPMAFGLAALAEPIIRLLVGAQAGDYADAVTALRVSALVTPFFYFNGVALEFLYAVQRNWYVTVCYGAAAAISVAANIAFAPGHGAIGAAWIAVAVNASISLLFVPAIRHDLAALGLGPLLAKLMLASAAMAGLAWALAPWSLWAAVAAGAAAYAALVFILRMLDADERTIVAGLFRRRN